jgi:GNAT superfamily N-acetyltransferase
LTGDRENKPRIEKLQAAHILDAFDCGQESLNRYLKRYALANQRANGAQTYLGLSGDDIIGFYSLVVGHVIYDDAPERLTKGLSRNPVPVMLLARLAVDLGWQGKGVGTGLLRDAMQRTLQVADIAGVRAFLVHAKGDAARAFYEHFDFAPSPTDPYHLYLLVSDIRKAMGVELSQRKR